MERQKKKNIFFFACPGGSLSPPPAFLPNSPCFPAAFDLSTHPPTTEQCYAAIDDCMKKGNVWRKSFPEISSSSAYRGIYYYNKLLCSTSDSLHFKEIFLVTLVNLLITVLIKYDELTKKYYRQLLH